MVRRSRSFARDDNGVIAVEFGLAIIPLMLVIVGAIEFMLFIFVGSSLEAAVQEASRYGSTGFVTEGIAREDTVREIIGKKTVGLVDMNKVEIETLVYENFDDIGQPEAYHDINLNGQYDGGEPFTDVNGNGQWDSDMGLAGLGGPGDVVVYRVTYPWAILTPIVQTVAGETITHQASIAVRNEPY